MSRILIVEDDPDLVALMKRWLEREDHAVEHATNGAAALEALARDPLPHLVLLDVMLPKVDGFEVLRRLRTEPRTKSLPVVMVSSFSRDKDAARGREKSVVPQTAKEEQVMMRKLYMQSVLKQANAAPQLVQIGGPNGKKESGAEAVAVSGD